LRGGITERTDSAERGFSAVRASVASVVRRTRSFVAAVPEVRGKQVVDSRCRVDCRCVLAEAGFVIPPWSAGLQIRRQRDRYRGGTGLRPADMNKLRRIQQMDKSRTATIGNAVLWIVTIIAAAVLGRDSEQTAMLIIIPVIAGAVSMYLVADAAGQG